MKTTVIFHSADMDGIFCREIARKFLPDAELIGWDFGDGPILLPGGRVYILDLPVDRVFGGDFSKNDDTAKSLAVWARDNVTWIDHHKSSIDTHPTDIPGYRIDGVSACRLAWQWFSIAQHNAQNQTNEAHQLPLPFKTEFVDRMVSEPLAVTLAGEYDVWNHEQSGGDDIAFQFGLDAQHKIEWDWILQEGEDNHPHIRGILDDGKAAMRCYGKRDADTMRSRSFKVSFAGLSFLALNTAKCNSNTFAALDVPETGHDALMAFCFTGKSWMFSFYHANHRKELDLSQVAVKYGNDPEFGKLGGGGHRGAAGCRMNKLPF